MIQQKLNGSTSFHYIEEKKEISKDHCWRNWKMISLTGEQQKEVLKDILMENDEQDKIYGRIGGSGEKEYRLRGKKIRNSDYTKGEQSQQQIQKYKYCNFQGNSEFTEESQKEITTKKREKGC